MMSLINRANQLQGKIDKAYEEAYAALQRANITLGIVKELSQTVPVEKGLNVAFRSIMGVEVPMVSLHTEKKPLPFGLMSTNILLDQAYLKFDEVKRLTAELAEVENSVYRLAYAVKKTQKRANALKNILIPRFEQTVKTITEALEEKDREDFSRMKIIKRQKSNKTA
jgi:V/A-type H+/Na+-transporting ATPase subunit D